MLGTLSRPEYYIHTPAILVPDHDTQWSLEEATCGVHDMAAFPGPLQTPPDNIECCPRDHQFFCSRDPE